MNALDLDGLLNHHFAGKVVRKDLTKLIKEGANVPVYVLEYLLGMYCASDDEEIRAVVGTAEYSTGGSSNQWAAFFKLWVCCALLLRCRTEF